MEVTTEMYVKLFDELTNVQEELQKIIERTKNIQIEVEEIEVKTKISAEKFKRFRISDSLILDILTNKIFFQKTLKIKSKFSNIK